MQRVFSSMDLSETVLVRDALMHHGIEIFTQNEYSNHSAIPEFRPPAEIWIVHDMHYDTARRLVALYPSLIARLRRRRGCVLTASPRIPRHLSCAGTVAKIRGADTSCRRVVRRSNYLKTPVEYASSQSSGFDDSTKGCNLLRCSLKSGSCQIRSCASFD